MSIPAYASVYRKSRSQESYLHQVRRIEERERRRKRKHAETENDAIEENDIHQYVDSDDDSELPASLRHPVSLTDEYFVAGHPREHSLPPKPFPHAAIKSKLSRSVSIEEELAALKPPVFNAPTIQGYEFFSLKRRSLDNITAIFHRCVLANDWLRASRAWALIVRSPIAGLPTDIRQNDLWAMAAEILIRREYPSSIHSSLDEPPQAALDQGISVDGLDAARDFYQKLTIQYPLKSQDSHDVVNAAAIHPCRFNIWIYAAQLRSKQARHQSKGQIPPEPSAQLLIRGQELEEAKKIMKELEELRRTPPYDSDSGLLDVQQMVESWISDLQTIVVDLAKDSSEQRRSSSPGSAFDDA